MAQAWFAFSSNHHAADQIGIDRRGAFTFMQVWNEFMQPMIYLNSDSKYTLALGLQSFKGMYNAQWHLMMSAATIVIMPAVIIFLIGQDYLIKGITMTGLKD